MALSAPIRGGKSTDANIEASLKSIAKNSRVALKTVRECYAGKNTATSDQAKKLKRYCFSYSQDTRRNLWAIYEKLTRAAKPKREKLIRKVIEDPTLRGKLFTGSYTSFMRAMAESKANGQKFVSMSDLIKSS